MGSLTVAQASLSHIKKGSACFEHFSSHILCKMNLYSGDTNIGPLGTRIFKLYVSLYS